MLDQREVPRQGPAEAEPLGVKCGAGVVGIKSPSLVLSWPGSWEREHCQPQRETQMGAVDIRPPTYLAPLPHLAVLPTGHPTPFGTAHVYGAGDSIQDPLGGKRAQHCWVQGQVN